MTSTPAARWQSVAIPPEHGSWGFLLEPLLLGLLVAPTWAGAGLALAVVGAFLVRQPLKIALMDHRRGRRYARTRLAERFTALYSLPVLIGGGLAVARAGWEPLIPLVGGAPLAAILFAGYAQKRGRDLLPELAGALALALCAASIALAGERSAGTACALWAILAARDVPSILYVRARLRLERDRPFSWELVVVANGLAIAGISALARIGTAPWLAVIALVVLLARALFGLSSYRRSVKTQTIGLLEIGYGLLTVLLAALGYALR
jgi:hypothetical protein